MQPRSSHTDLKKLYVTNSIKLGATNIETQLTILTKTHEELHMAYNVASLFDDEDEKAEIAEKVNDVHQSLTALVSYTQIEDVNKQKMCDIAMGRFRHKGLFTPVGNHSDINDGNNKASNTPTFRQ